MAFVQFSQVSLAFGDRDILKNVSVNLQTGTKAALTGANGAGKSTLIKVMAGLVQPDSGNRICQKDARIAYLPQSGLTHHGCTLREEADKAFQFGYDIQKEIDGIGDMLETVKPDLIEIMPGIVGKVIKRFVAYGIPVIAGGLIETKQEITEALKNGAEAISTGKQDLWYV